MDRPAAPSRRTPRTALQEFLAEEASGGIVLIIGSIIALIWANSRWHVGYEDLLDTHLTIGLGRFGLTLSLHHWVNDGLMAVFFFVVGLEIKRELVAGELRDRRAATLPAIAALGGMVVPALVFLAFNLGHPASNGWGIPMATDIAFAVGVLALLGSRVPQPLKVFLLALAIVDDIGAIIVIAVFYTDHVEAQWLLAAVGVLVAMLGAWRVGVRSKALYVTLAVALWVCVHASGVHATIAGVTLGLLLPTATHTNGRGKALPPAQRVEHLLHPWSSFVIVPIFAFANVGVRISAGSFDGPGSTRAALGVGVGLVVGKLVGISGATALAVRLRWGTAPEGATPLHIIGVALLGGIGFTVSLFVADLAFDSSSLQGAAKIGILSASLVAALSGAAVLRSRPPVATTSS